MGSGEKSLQCDPGSELRLGGGEKKKGEDNIRDGKKEGKERAIGACCKILPLWL